jgi:hypothetical protein
VTPVWTFTEIRALVHAQIEAGDTFYTRRVLQRVERRELTIGEGTALVQTRGRIGAGEKSVRDQADAARSRPSSMADH